MPFTSLLVPLDFGPDGDRALHVAGRIAAEAGLPVEILTVTDPRLDPETDTNDLLYRADQIRPVACTVTLLRSEDVPGSLVEAFRARPDALPVIGTAARGALGELLDGGVWQSVLAETGRPALLVGRHVVEGDVEASRMLVAVTEACDSDGLADAVSDWAETFGATVSVADLLGEGGLARGTAQATLREASSALRRHGILAPMSVIRSDHVARTVRELAAEGPPAVVAMVSERWVTPDRVHHVSVARDVVRTAAAPVLVVPRPRRKALGRVA
jgi:nucleotide-binding universal stress UspA family protein